MSGRRVVIDNLTEVELHHIRLGLEILVELHARECVVIPEAVALRDRVQRMADQLRGWPVEPGLFAPGDGWTLPPRGGLSKSVEGD